MTLFFSYFIIQVIQWMQNPTELTGLRDFQEWKEKCDVKGQPFCSLPNACPLTTRYFSFQGLIPGFIHVSKIKNSVFNTFLSYRELPGEILRLHTCMECPNNYPWILDP